MKKILHICMLSLLPMGYAWADVVSNFANEKNQACKPFVVSDSALFAGSFTTGSFGGGYNLDDIRMSVVSVSLDATASKPGGKFVVQLWSDSVGTPGSILETLTQGTPVSPGIKAFGSSKGTLLNSNTRYWVSVTVQGGNDLSVSLEQTNLKTEISTPVGWTIGDSNFSLVDGTPKIDDACVPYLKITAVPVPEPSSVALLGLTGAGLMFLARRRK